MDIRNGKYLTQDNKCTDEFRDLLQAYTIRFEYAAQNTSLPDKPDFQRINELVMEINRSILA